MVNPSNTGLKALKAGFADASLTSPPKERSKQQPTILLVDDDHDLRVAFGTVLGTTGFVVVPCKDAEVASNAFRAPGDIDLLVTDLQMPGRSGLDLARELSALKPSLPVLIVTGSLLSEDCLREMRDRSWCFQSKPCGPHNLLHAVHSMAAKREIDCVDLQ